MDVVWVLNSLVNGELQDITATVLNLFESKVRWPFLSLLFGWLVVPCWYSYRIRFFFVSFRMTRILQEHFNNKYRNTTSFCVLWMCTFNCVGVFSFSMSWWSSDYVLEYSIFSLPFFYHQIQSYQCQNKVLLLWQVKDGYQNISSFSWGGCVHLSIPGYCLCWFFFFEPLYTVNVNVSLSRQKPHSCIWMIGSNYLSKLTVCAL